MLKPVIVNIATGCVNKYANASRVPTSCFCIFARKTSGMLAGGTRHSIKTTRETRGAGSFNRKLWTPYQARKQIVGTTASRVTKRATITRGDTGQDVAVHFLRNSGDGTKLAAAIKVKHATEGSARVSSVEPTTRNEPDWWKSECCTGGSNAISKARKHETIGGVAKAFHSIEVTRRQRGNLMDALLMVVVGLSISISWGFIRSSGLPIISG